LNRNICIGCNEKIPQKCNGICDKCWKTENFNHNILAKWNKQWGKTLALVAIIKLIHFEIWDKLYEFKKDKNENLKLGLILTLCFIGLIGVFAFKDILK